MTSSTRSSRTEAKETRLIVSFGFELARRLEIGKVVVLAELLTDRRLVEKHREEESIIWVTDKPDSIEVDQSRGDTCVSIPRSPAGRMDQVSLALIIAVMNGTVTDDETVVCLIGVAGSKRLDNLLLANPKRDFDWFSNHAVSENCNLPISQEFVRLIDIALKFAAEGREGKPIGTVFLLGDIKEMNTVSRALILNPCQGHPKKYRSIHDGDFVETMREFSALDGGFLVDTKGTVERAGVYLDAPVTKKVKVQKGLGSRHLAAAAATAKISALAIVISESSGTVTVFFDGSKVLSLNRPAD
jgi:hypothetical protein